MDMATAIRFAERIFLIFLSVSVILRLWPQMGTHPQVILFLFSELVGVAFILFQRRGQTSTDFYPVAVAFLGTCVSLLIVPQGTQLVSDAVSTTLVIAGAAIALGAKLSLRRSFGIVPANRGVKRGGLYRFVRHPMYSGYIVNQIGFLLLYFSMWNVAIYAVAWLAFLARAKEEEKFLLQDPEYQDYSAQVRARLVPGLV